ncbi:MAG: PAS domain S-box protein, partial [Dehalococcoidia bacterium]|nr:PAS domain S-box protein [Dehalococcoidia bacterium]
MAGKSKIVVDKSYLRASAISQRQEAQELLKLVEKNYGTIFENSSIAITLADDNENIVFWNKFAETLLGMDRDDLYMKPVSSLYPEAEWRRIRSQNVRKKGMQHHLE